MSGLRSLFASQSSGATTPDYTGLQIQTAVNALPVPIVWGATKIAPNVIWYANFKTNNDGGSGEGKGGNGGGGGSGNVTYSADVILALCEGPITGIGTIWRGQSLYSLASLGLSLFTGTTPQTPWGYLAANYPSQSLGYNGTAYVAEASYDLTTAATLDNHNFEVFGLQYQTGWGPGYSAPDADPSEIVNDFLTSVQFGVGLPASSIDTTTLFGSGGDASYQTYCRAVGLSLSPALTDTETASSILSRWLQLTNTAAVWTGGLLRFIPYGDQAVTGNSITFQPATSAIYNLTDDDYKFDDGEDPIKVTVSDLFEAYNVWRLECCDRSDAYNLVPIESRDQNAIELVAQVTGTRGERISPTVTAHEICDTNIAALSGQLMLQRAIYIRNTYKLRLSWEHCLLDPMDLVAVTDAVLGLNNTLIRITEIDEDDSGFLEVTAEEFTPGVCTATLYPNSNPSNNPINRNIAVAPVNTPVILEPPASLVGATPQIWIAASGGAGGVVDPNWGGCNVLISVDNVTYERVGSIIGPAIQGVTTAILPSYSGTNPDSIDTLSVNTAESGGVLIGASNLVASLAGTLCYIDGELISFEIASLASANNYDLSAIYRGLYGTTAGSHSSGGQFAALSGTSGILQFNLPAQFVNVELFIKLQSFNVFGGGLQDVSTCTAYTFIPSGVATEHPIGSALAATTVMDFGLTSDAVGTSDDFGTTALPVSIDDDLGLAA